MTLSLPEIEEKQCASHTEGESDLPIPKAWSGGERAPIGRACLSDKPLPGCSGGGCVSTNAAFRSCIVHEGEQACPEGWNSDRQVLYQHIEDTRDCTPCGCDPPNGAACKVKWRIFSDSSCTAQTSENDISADMMQTGCVYVDTGIALAGKTAEIIDYTKGSCAPIGGELVGDLKPIDPFTVCCYASTM